MKCLYLVRHAKSDRSDPSLRDFDRPLDERGHHDASVMADRIMQRGIVPDRILASPALRAATTAKIFARSLALRGSALFFDDDLYSASAHDILRIVRRIPDSVETLFLVGHNNAITIFAEGVLNKKLGSLPTCGIVNIAFHQDDFLWANVRAGSGEMIFFEYPKLYPRL